MEFHPGKRENWLPGRPSAGRLGGCPRSPRLQYGKNPARDPDFQPGAIIIKQPGVKGLPEHRGAPNTRVPRTLGCLIKQGCSENWGTPPYWNTPVCGVPKSLGLPRHSGTQGTIKFSFEFTTQFYWSPIRGRLRHYGAHAPDLRVAPREKWSHAGRLVGTPSQLAGTP